MSNHRANGKVARIYPTDGSTNSESKGLTYIGIHKNSNNPDEPRPFENYFTISTDHPNYNAIYSLALSAAINGDVLHIAASEDITPDKYAEIVYIYVDWNE